MAGKTTVTLERLGHELYHIVLNASAESKPRILHSCSNASLKMDDDIKTLYYLASGLQVKTQKLIGGYRPLFDVKTEGDASFIRVGITNATALTDKGFNYAVLHEFGGKHHRAREVATKAVKHQGTILVNKLLQEIGF